jgi:hypothetical protein
MKDQGQMAKDKATEVLLEALRQALASTAEQPIFKTGNQTGLFVGKTGIHLEAAERAKREGFLEVTRTETKGKTTIEWARITPAGVDFLYEQESPLRVLSNLQEVLQSNRQGFPAWLSQMQEALHQISNRLSLDAQRWSQQLEALQNRVTHALQRLETREPNLNNGMLSAVPWATDALSYLDRRALGGEVGSCTIRELFAALKPIHAGLSLASFHSGLRRLRDGRIVRLLPASNGASSLAEPEYALLDGGDLLYFVTR